MTGVFVVVEGLTEFSFVQNILKPHLERLLHSLSIKPVRQKEGFTYAGLKKDVRRLLNGPRLQVAVTTMIDLYRIPATFPGVRESEGNPLEHVRNIEHLFANDIDDARFIPYIQLHEFEALVLCGLRVLEERYPHRRVKIRALEKRISGKFRSAEEVNRLQSPSRHILQAIPEYSKIVDGIHVVQNVGIAELRQRCLHFGEWLTKIERASTPNH